MPDASVSGCETISGQRSTVPAVCRILCCIVPGLSRNLSDLTGAFSQYDILSCSDMRHISELLVPRFNHPVLLILCWVGCLGPDGRLHTSEMNIDHFSNSNFEWGCYEMLVFMVCGARQNFYFFCILRNTDLDD